MGLYEQWKKTVEGLVTPQQQNLFWADYFEREKENYRRILEQRMEKLEGKLKDLADGFGMDAVMFTGFLDGINTSLKEELDLDSLEEETELSAEIDFEKLYWNMHEARADWLYNLKEWDGILSEERRKELTKEFRLSKMAVSNKVGRNDPCPCGSGKKYKKCCGAGK
ncbi:MAG TPA: SEC-C metal-binding domain-containing protein [Clostridiales bacterium]|nr:SEC-C metal-binding domain-containing protein [Clostridiales bacterium]HPV01488.1 SEC-C metal-binding domain-containing protein [Clostridiales bacterium]